MVVFKEPVPVALHARWILQHIGKRLDGFEANEFFCPIKRQITSLPEQAIIKKAEGCHLFKKMTSFRFQG